MLVYVTCIIIHCINVFFFSKMGLLVEREGCEFVCPHLCVRLYTHTNTHMHNSLVGREGSENISKKKEIEH